MSYDLMVFEKTKAPTNPTEFFSWYQKQTEWNDNCDYNDYSHASEKLQKFFHKIKDIFPPMNGPFSPTNKELSENPDLEERLFYDFFQETQTTHDINWTEWCI